MLVDIALSNREAPLVMPGDKGGLVMTIDDRVIRRAYCDLVFREIEQSKAKNVAALTLVQRPYEYAIVQCEPKEG